MAKPSALPSNRMLVWGLLLGLVGAAIYQADVFGIRTKVLDRVFNTTPKASI